MGNDTMYDFEEEITFEDVSFDAGEIDLDELEKKLESQLESEFENVEELKEELKSIQNPDNLGKVILDEVWQQFGNQIGLDMTNETLIQKYDREHPETYDEVGKKVMQDERYKSANKEMKEKQQSGQLKDEYTGKDLKVNEKANLDHTVSRKEIYENKRRRQAGIETEDLANKKENLNATNEALNKSKSAKSVDEMIKTREEREKKLREQNERANKKIDESNMSETEKRLAKEKNNKRLQDKLDADDALMKKKDVEARRAINKDITKGVVKQTAKKAGTDALKTMAISALFTMLKEIMNALVRFFKAKEKSFKYFLEEMKNAVKGFFSKIFSVLQTGASTLIGTIISEIFGPIVSMFKKLASFIKQGVSSVIDAIKYLSNPENKNQPMSIKIAQIGKIFTATLSGMGAIALGEVFEKVLMTYVPVMNIQIPLLGSLANITGLFLASVLSGVIGAIIINFLDKFIAEENRKIVRKNIATEKNEILATETELLVVNYAQKEKTKNEVGNSIAERHQRAAEYVKDASEEIRNNSNYERTDTERLENVLSDIWNKLEEF